jgi:hypothetical protein
MKMQVAMISRITIDLKKQRGDRSSETSILVLSKFECRNLSLECDLGNDLESREGVVCKGTREPPAIHAVPSTNAGDSVRSERSPTKPCPETCHQSQIRNSDKFEDEWIEMAGLRC